MSEMYKWLAERLARSYRFAQVYPESALDTCEMDAIGIIETISETHAIVPRDRLERLRDAAAIYAAELSGRCDGYVGATRQCTSVLEPGDLDPIGGAE